MTSPDVQASPTSGHYPLTVAKQERERQNVHHLNTMLKDHKKVKQLYHTIGKPRSHSDPLLYSSVVTDTKPLPTNDGR
jgi:hypothetical protein